nr:hypothetical protein CFP56_78387 [Quercus suber]
MGRPRGCSVVDRFETHPDRRTPQASKLDRSSLCRLVRWPRDCLTTRGDGSNVHDCQEALRHPDGCQFAHPESAPSLAGSGFWLAQMLARGETEPSDLGVLPEAPADTVG